MDRKLSMAWIQCRLPWGLAVREPSLWRRAVKWVAFVKSAVLDLFSETELRGRAPMSLAVARLLSESRYYSSLMLESSATTEDIIGLHRSANVTIAEVVDWPRYVFA